jgi:hypothetical protein
MIPTKRSDSNKNSFKEWLEILQQESWQLELLISGFAIFLLVQTGHSIDQMYNFIDYNIPGGIVKGIVSILGGAIAIARIFLIINLILHVIFRGLWIATIGLRYVSGDINWEALKYGPTFTKYLSKKVGDFDSYIEQLEKICSVFFAFSFIIIFCLISASMVLVSIILMGSLINFVVNATVYAIIFVVIIMLFIMVFLLTALIYFIDFITFGRLKRWEAISIIYLPIYRFFSIITLSFLYRPLIYNMVDNKFGKRLSLLFVPYIAIGLFIGTLKVEHEFYKPKEYNGKYRIPTFYYEDQLLGKNPKVGRLLIPSMEIESDHLKLFIRTIPRTDKQSVALLCPDFEPLQKSGIVSSLYFRTNIPDKEGLSPDQLAESGLNCWSKMYEIKIDTTTVEEVDYNFYHHPKYDVDGVLCIIPLDSVSKGKHFLNIEKTRIDNEVSRSKKLVTSNYATVPFWRK